MTTIIAGTFQQQDHAQAAVAEILSAGFPAAQTTTFFVNPPGDPERNEQPRRKSGILVAVCVSDSAQQATAVRISRGQGGVDIEQAEGTISAGDWSDFNPLRPVMRIN